MPTENQKTYLSGTERQIDLKLGSKFKFVRCLQTYLRKWINMDHEKTVKLVHAQQHHLVKYRILILLMIKYKVNIKLASNINHIIKRVLLHSIRLSKANLILQKTMFYSLADT